MYIHHLPRQTLKTLSGPDSYPNSVLFTENMTKQGLLLNTESDPASVELGCGGGGQNEHGKPSLFRRVNEGTA